MNPRVSHLIDGVITTCLLVSVLSVRLQAEAAVVDASEHAEIIAICQELVGSQFPYDGLPWQRPWQRLLRYLPNKDALYREPLVCSGSCSGSVRLRNGMWLNFTFPNPQKFGKQWDSSDGRIDSVELVRGNKVIFSNKKKPVR